MPGDELSQEDIDRLLGGSQGPSAAKPAPGGEDHSAGAAAPAVKALSARSPQTAASDGAIRPEAAFDLLRDVPLKVRIELGRSRMYIEDILRLGKGSVVELDKLAGDPLDILVNDRLVAKGELIVLDDNFCIRVTEIVSPEKRREQQP